MEATDKKYLEAIFIIKDRENQVRAAHIARQLEVSRTSVCRALKKLEELEYIQIDVNKCIYLTTLGLEKAQSVYNKHILVEQFLSKVINVPHEIAYKDASRMSIILVMKYA